MLAFHQHPFLVPSGRQPGEVPRAFLGPTERLACLLLGSGFPRLAKPGCPRPCEELWRFSSGAALSSPRSLWITACGRR